MTRLLAIVTGGAGFIGSHLVERLLSEGLAVRVLDNFASGRRANLAHLRDSNLSVHEVDVADATAITPLFADAEWVFHLAGLADIVPSIQRPLEYHRANVDGTVAVLEAARAAGARRLIYAASSSCYGIPPVHPTAETAPIAPRYPYALTKYLGEHLVLHWAQVYHLPALSLRLFNVYGPRARTSGTYGAVFGVFLAQKLVGRPLTIVGDGEQTRDFTFVADVADAFVRAAQSSATGEIINIGAGRAQSINHLARLLGGATEYIPKRPGEPDCTLADIAKARRLIGWEPKVAFEEGVRIMLDHIDDWRDARVWTPAAIEEATRDWFKCLG